MRLVPALAIFGSRTRAVLHATGAVCIVVLGGSQPAMAQSYECEQIRQQIAASSRGDPARYAQYQRAAQRQRTELARTQSYAAQVGCQQGFSLFGNDEPAQCDGIMAQIARMNSNLEALNTQAEGFRAGDSGQQATLQDHYRTYCSTGIVPNDPYADPAQSGADDVPPEPADDAPRGRGGKAICVRSCDGGFFPLTFSSQDRTAGGLQALCTALCPNTEAKLYTTPDTDDIGAAVSSEGASYKDLPNAFKFQKSFDSTCTCKPPNKTWVEALADAEMLLDKSRGNDVTVTSKMSDDMQRPGTGSVPTAATPTKRKAAKNRKPVADLDALRQ